MAMRGSRSCAERKCSSTLKGHLQDEHGQMTIELALLFPILIVIAVIAMNALLFFGECASFDRVARNAVRILVASPQSEAQPAALTAQVEAAVRQETGLDDVKCTMNGSASGINTYSVSCSFAPTLFGMGLRSEIWGIPLPKLAHTTQLALDTYNMRNAIEHD